MQLEMVEQGIETRSLTWQSFLLTAVLHYESLIWRLFMYYSEP